MGAKKKKSGGENKSLERKQWGCERDTRQKFAWDRSQDIVSIQSRGSSVCAHRHCRCFSFVVCLIIQGGLPCTESRLGSPKEALCDSPWAAQRAMREPKGDEV